MNDDYRRGFEQAFLMTTRVVERLIPLVSNDKVALSTLKALMSDLYSGHCYHLPTRWKDSGLAIVMGLMRLAGSGSMFYRFDPDRVHDDEEGN